VRAGHIHCAQAPPLGASTYGLYVLASRMASRTASLSCLGCAKAIGTASKRSPDICFPRGSVFHRATSLRTPGYDCKELRELIASCPTPHYYTLSGHSQRDKTLWKKDSPHRTGLQALRFVSVLRAHLRRDHDLGA
jgi:hypothetical protein